MLASSKCWISGEVRLIVETSNKCCDQPLSYQVSIFESEFSQQNGRFFLFVSFFFVECCIFNAIEQVGGRIHHGARVSLKLSVFLGAFFGLGIYPGFIPTSSSLTRSRCVTVTHPNFFVYFFSPKKMLVKLHKYFRFPNQKNWLKNHVLDRCFFGDPGLELGALVVDLFCSWEFEGALPMPPFLDKALIRSE